MNGGRPKLGYLAVVEPRRQRWEIDPEEATLVQRMFEMCLSGMPTRAIARHLTEACIPTYYDRHPEAGGRPKRLPWGVWGPGTVQSILTYEGYVGKVYWGKAKRVGKTRMSRQPRDEWIEVAIPAIIDEETFLAAQVQLRRNRERSPRNRKYEYLLVGGRLRCGRCGRTVTGAGTARGRRYYRCASRNAIVDRQLQCRGSLEANDVESRVWVAVERILNDPDVIQAEVARQHAEADHTRAEILPQLELLETALGKCDREETRWAEAYAAEVINIRELKAYRADIALRRQRLHAERVAVQAGLDAIGHLDSQAQALVAYCERVRQNLRTFTAAERRRALDALDVRVSWTPGEPLTIAGTIPLSEDAIRHYGE